MIFETRLTEARDPIVRNGTLIKVGCNGERFWCVVREAKSHEQILAVVDNHLIRLPWRFGHLLDVKLDNVLETSEKGDSAHLSALMDTYESISDAALAWYAERLADGRTVKVAPSVLLVLPA